MSTKMYPVACHERGLRPSLPPAPVSLTLSRQL